MTSISIDIETFSSVNLQKSGVYRYAESDDFEILLFGYSIDGGDVKVIDIACGEKIPQQIIEAIIDESVIKWAFNAQFERICLSRYLSDLGISFDPFYDNHPLSDHCARYLNPSSWCCTMVWAATLGLPLSLEGVGAVLNLEKQKLQEGKKLIKYFCIPCSKTNANDGRTRNMPDHDIDKWRQFVAYNVRDIETEMGIQNKLSRFPAPESIWNEYHLDQEINDRGVGMDMQLVSHAIAFDEEIRRKCLARAQKLTGLENPNSPIQLKEWLTSQGVRVNSLTKAEVANLMKKATGKPLEVLQLRVLLSKSSVRKYTAMENVVCKNSRARGMFQFYGANRTGRFSGRLIQLQNLPQNHMSDLAEARGLVRSGNYNALEFLYDDIPDTLSQLIRTAFVPQVRNED
ncbi:MAG: polymerase bacteriophage-type [Acetobacterium sp.]|nr:polymerase bacteriophage-type [Acetobacterium sp.]